MQTSTPENRIDFSKYEPTVVVLDGAPVLYLRKRDLQLRDLNDPDEPRTLVR